MCNISALRAAGPERWDTGREFQRDGWLLGDLHDGLLQNLTAAAVYVAVVRRRLGDSESGDAAAMADMAGHLLDDELDRLRRIIDRIDVGRPARLISDRGRTRGHSREGTPFGSALFVVPGDGRVLGEVRAKLVGSPIERALARRVNRKARSRYAQNWAIITARESSESWQSLATLLHSLRTGRRGRDAPWRCRTHVPSGGIPPRLALPARASCTMAFCRACARRRCTSVPAAGGRRPQLRRRAGHRGHQHAPRWRD